MCTAGVLQAKQRNTDPVPGLHKAKRKVISLFSGVGGLELGLRQSQPQPGGVVPTQHVIFPIRPKTVGPVKQ